MCSKSVILRAHTSTVKRQPGNRLLSIQPNHNRYPLPPPRNGEDQVDQRRTEIYGTYSRRVTCFSSVERIWRSFRTGWLWITTSQRENHSTSASIQSFLSMVESLVENTLQRSLPSQCLSHSSLVDRRNIVCLGLRLPDSTHLCQRNS
jgi:hypothetical protein